jgi:putative endonuclease
MIERHYYVYMLASRRNGTLYIGVTNDLARRVAEHRSGSAAGFTRKYGVRMLVWFEAHTDIEAAILREKRIKAWNRAWKIALIEDENIGWRDLAENLGLGPLVTVASSSPAVIPAQAGTHLGSVEQVAKNGSPPARG